MGGPMMGFSMISDLVPVVKTTNCILAPADNEMAGNNEQACIRCSACADACPASLLPQQLFWHSKAKELDKAQEYNLFDCIECGACAYVCPSEIPLVHYYRIAKSEVRVEQEDKQKSDKARDRFEKREARLVSEQQARDEKHRLAAQARKEAMASSGNNAKDKIAAALARAKAKKQTSNTADETPIGITDVTPIGKPEQEATDTSTKIASSNQRVQAAIARAKAKKAAAELIVTNAQIKDKKEMSDVKEQVFEVESNPIIVPLVYTQPALTDYAPQDVVSKKNKPTQADDRQAKITSAVAKAKSKHETQKCSHGQDTSNPAVEAQMKSTEAEISVELDKTEEQLIDMKKRRITAAVAKAKAKKAAEKEAISREDKPS
jgi:electron transport complex protein RnfC